MPALTSAAQNPPARRPDAKPNTQAQYSVASESENVNFAHDKKIRQIAVSCVYKMQRGLRRRKIVLQESQLPDLTS